MRKSKIEIKSRIVREEGKSLEHLGLAFCVQQSAAIEVLLKNYAAILIDSYASYMAMC